jgi:hypothetical protein
MEDFVLVSEEDLSTPDKVKLCRVDVTHRVLLHITKQQILDAVGTAVVGIIDYHLNDENSTFPCEIVRFGEYQVGTQSEQEHEIGCVVIVKLGFNEVSVHAYMGTVDDPEFCEIVARQYGKGGSVQAVKPEIFGKYFPK